MQLVNQGESSSGVRIEFLKIVTGKIQTKASHQITSTGLDTNQVPLGTLHGFTFCWLLQVQLNLLGLKNVTKMEDDTKIKFSWMLVDEEEKITALRSIGKYLGVDIP